MSAEGLADLQNELAVSQVLCRVLAHAYLSIAGIVVASTDESSLTKCGLLPVLSSCWIAPTTISSLIPSTSILLSPSLSGDGGGDSAAPRFGFCSLVRMAVDRGGLMSPRVGEALPWDRFDFLTGGSSPSTAVLGGEGWMTTLARLGAMMPISVSDSDFRRVL